MLIRALRLKNVKSFGEGPGGAGWRVVFERGLNRIAGPNGSGKSTLIEALGYALFDCPPLLGPRADLHRALLRQGTREGEIEVELEDEEGVWFVRRGVGVNSKLRWTVRDASGFLTHETEADVRRFLAAAMKLDVSGHLPSLFRKLVGVRQGRILGPFELPRAEARRHFAPILDVEVYQRCFTELKAPAGRLKEELLKAEGEIKAARGEVDFYSDAPAEAARLEARLREAAPEREKRKAALAEARTRQDEWDERQRAATRADQALATARQDVRHADARLAERRALLQRAEGAQKVLESASPDHAAYLKADRELAELQARRAEFEALRERLARLRQEYAAAEARALEGEQQARARLDQIEKDAQALAARQAEWKARREALEAERQAPEAPHLPAERIEPLLESLAELERWSAGLHHAAEGVRRNARTAAEANRALADFDPQHAIRAQAQRDEARRAFEQAQGKFAEVEARRRARREMARRLEESQHCPLLAERCKQFDPGRVVLSEVKLDEELERERAAFEAAGAALRRAEEEAGRAEEAMRSTEKIRHDAAHAIEEIHGQRTWAADPARRQAFETLAGALAAMGAPAAPLPELPALPDPGAEPWRALAEVPKVAEGLGVFVSAVSERLAGWKETLESRQEASAERRRRWEGLAKQLEAEHRALAEREAELERRRKEHAEALRSVRESLAESERLHKSIEELRARQAPLVELEERVREAGQRRQAAAEGHRRYLAAETEAGRLGAARAEVAVALGDLENARRGAEASLAAREKAIAAYDPAAHDQAKAALPGAAGALSALERDMERDHEQLEEVRRRIEILKAAQETLKTHESRRALLAARLELLEHARRALRDAGPQVAEHLVNAVNARAQKIYSALCPRDPGQLQWQTDYELRVATSSGVRRFAMLSGGQQVKSALALQVALVQQFSRAGLCIFDEPTYALDRESRALLAEALAEAQRLARFTQLFIVSHDDAFDGHVEHTVWLDYAPATGSFLRDP